MGDWPQWRGGPQQTGYQMLPGRITHPQQLATYEIGGALNAAQTIFAKDTQGNPVTIVSPSGSVSAYRANGTLLWTHTDLPNEQLVGTYDFNGDGHPEILTCTPGGGPTRLRIFSIDTGAEIWSSPAHDGSIGAFKAADVNGDGATDLVWAPAASSVVRAYSFKNGFNVDQPMWETTIDDYVSDPYSFSPLVIGDVDGDGQQDIVVFGGRRRVTVAVLAGSTGAITARTDYVKEEMSDRLVEGGGAFNLLQLRDVDHDGTPEIIVVSAYGSADTYMFQGIAVIRGNDVSAALFRNCYPVGPQYVADSVRDFDGDGFDDLLISQFDPKTSTYSTELVDLIGLQTKARLDGFLVRGIVSDAAGTPILLGHFSNAESGQDSASVVAVEYRDHEFRQLWSVGYAAPFTRLVDHDPRPDIENPGWSIETFDATGNGDVDLIVRGDSGLDALDIRTGQVVATYRPQTDEPVTFVKRSPLDNSMFVSFADGAASIMQPGFKTSGTLHVSGYLRLSSTNNHGGAVAVAADVDGDGRNEIYASTSTNRLLRIDYPQPNAERIFTGSVPLQPVARPDVKSLFLKACPGSVANICRVFDDGLTSWTVSVPDEAGGGAIPTSINIGRRSATEHTLFTSSSHLAPQPVRAFDADSGVALWKSQYGTGGDGSFALWDFNGDGVDDVIFNSSLDKGIVISGVDGSLLASPVNLDPYGVLGYVDYNGVPALIQIDGQTCMVDTEDDAHMALLHPDLLSGKTEIVWSAEQTSIDDERHSMSAIAPDPVLGAIIGTGTHRGVFIARDALTGRELWRHELYRGTFGSSDEQHALGSVVAVDVDGQDGPDFVVGSDDGYLYAINAWSGRLVWSMYFGYPVGDPVAADVDGDGASEIIVAAADGKLHIIGSAVKRRATR